MHYIVGDVGASPFVAGATFGDVAGSLSAICIWCWHVRFRGRGSIGDFGMSLFVAERHTIW